jgi:Tol biopolymer transport system component
MVTLPKPLMLLMRLSILSGVLLSGCSKTNPAPLVPTNSNLPSPPASTASTPIISPVTAPRISAAPSPAGQVPRIAFVSDRDGNSDIYVMNPDSSGLTRLTENPAEDAYPTWSPDRRQIAFVSDRDGNPEIYLMNADGSNQARITHSPASEWVLTWSGDGKRIGFSADYEIYAINLDGSGLTNLTNNTAADYHPTWSPDGARIAFVSERDGKVAIYVMRADGTDVKRLTHNDFSSFPAWSPDSRRISYSGISVMDADGAHPAVLLDDPKVGERAAWSPDGTKIAFSSARDGNLEIYVMNVDGTGIVRLTDNPAHDRMPVW